MSSPGNDCITPTGPEMAAVRKLLTHIAGYGEDDQAPDRLVVMAAEACEQYDDLADEVAHLRSEIDAMQSRLPDPDATDYAALDREDKAIIIRRKLANVAENRGGKASMDYNDVVRTFDGRPSAGHAYDLMELAATVDGFDYGASPDGTKRITVNTDAVNDDADFHGVNKAPERNHA